MNYEWNLDPLYKGLDDPKYEKDMTRLEASCAALKEEAIAAVNLQAEGGLTTAEVEKLLLTLEDIVLTAHTLGGYQGFKLSVNSEDGAMMAQQARLDRILADNAESTAICDKIFGSIGNAEAMAEESPVIRDNLAYIRQKKMDLQHMLSEKEEAMVSAMDMTGGSAWSTLRDYLASTMKVDYNGEIITLTQARNLAYSSDQKVRKAAYEAELAAYDQIADSAAFALNNIKNQTTMLCHKRGFETALEETLYNSRMSQATLDAMFDAIREYLPVFRKYLRKKGELLGSKNGVAFYDMFAPLGKSEKFYSVERSREILVSTFAEFSQDLADMMDRAYEEEWIDFYPKHGKSGGAYCSEVASICQSRILTNYDHSFSSVSTLAHELGHAYHNEQIFGHRPLNQDYPMPVAETASTFNEIFLCNYALKNASDEEKLGLLDNDLVGNTQCVVDIYSRFLFEKAVFEQSQNKFLMKEDLKQLMLWAQNEAYGDGLDPEYRHPYMWVNKSHYYISGLSYYNFPYAFGTLFAQGIYAMYCKQGPSFVEKYKKMLSATPFSTIEEDGQYLGVDLTDSGFWKDSLAMLANEIEQFCELADKMRK